MVQFSRPQSLLNIQESDSHTILSVQVDLRQSGIDAYVQVTKV